MTGLRPSTGLVSYSRLRLAPGEWPVVRVDGRSFSAFTRDRYDKPFDPTLSNAMRTTAAKLVDELGGVLAYTESDEVSVLLPRHWDMFDRRVEKLVSVSAGIASATFTAAAGEPAPTTDDAARPPLSDRAQLAYDDEARISAFRELVFRLRTDAGLTQNELAARMGTTESAIVRMEGGGTRPTLETLERLAAAVGSDLVIAIGPRLSENASIAMLINDGHAIVRRPT